MDTFLRTKTSAYQRALVNNSSMTSWPAASSTTILTEPATVDESGGSATGNYIITTANSDNELAFIAFGEGSDGSQFDIRLVGWCDVEGSDHSRIWVPTDLLLVTCTLSTLVGQPTAAGAATSALIADERVCDTITINTSLADQVSTREILSPANNTAAVVFVHGLGYPIIGFYFNRDAATTANVAIRSL